MTKNEKSRFKPLAGLVLLKAVILLIIGLVASQWSKGMAQTKFLDISINGSYSRSFSQYSESVRKSLGLELGLPLSSFFEVSLAHNLIQESTRYNESYREAIKDRVTLDPGPITSSRTIQDYSANGDLGYAFGSVRPSIFGGALRSKICDEDFIEDRGCQTQDLTWNAGFSFQAYMTSSLRLKLSIRFSPSADKDRKNKTYDQLTSVGLTWGL
jgi:hypothetical protein